MYKEKSRACCYCFSWKCGLLDFSRIVGLSWKCGLSDCTCCSCKEPVCRSKYLSHHSSLLLHKLSSSICIADEFIFWDTAYFCPPVGANFVPGSCCCTEPNLSEDTNRKTFCKHEAVQMSLPTVKWLFSITDCMSTFAPSNGRQGIHVGTLLVLLPF